MQMIALEASADSSCGIVPLSGDQTLDLLHVNAREKPGGSWSWWISGFRDLSTCPAGNPVDA